MANYQQSTKGEALIKGTPFAYEITGTGQPLILVHAGIADRRMWDEQVSAFAQYYQVVRYDQRGYGQTPMVAQPFAHYRDLHDLLTHLGIQQASLLGSSMGGATVIDFALAYPEMVNALVLVTSNINGFEFNDDELPKLYEEHIEALKSGDIPRAAAVEAQYWVCGPQRTADQVNADILTQVSAMNVIPLTNKVDDQESEQHLEPVAIDRLAEIHAPTLVLIGDIDDANIVQCGERLATTILGSQKVVMNGTAHFPNLERPAEFNQIVLDFLATI